MPEAKRWCSAVLRHYVTEIAKKQPFAPFGFMANGHDIWFWEVGLTNPRLVAGFFEPADLERLKDRFSCQGHPA